MKRSTDIGTAIAERRAGPLAALACLVVLVVLVVLAAPATAAPPGWSKPVSIAGSASGPRVALSGEGGAAAVWEATRGTFPVIEGSIHVDGKWAFTSTLHIGGFEPSIAALGEGEAIAVWDGSFGVEAALATPRGWTSLPPIPHSVLAFAPEVAADGSGRATVVWRQPGLGGARIDAATRAPGGGWSAARPLSRSGGAGPLSRPDGVAFSPQVAVTPSGAAVAVWRRKDGAKSIVQAAVSGRPGHWSAAANLSAPGQNAVAPAVAIDPAGEAVAVWQRFDGAHQIIQAAARPAGGRWSNPAHLSAAGRNAEAPSVALSSTGEAVVAWERFDGRVDRIQATTRPRGGRWTPPRNLSAAHRSAHGARLAIDAAGLARVVWQASEANGTAVAEASRPPGGSWSAPGSIAEGPAVRSEPAIALAGEGEGVVVWAGYGLGAAFHPPSPPSP